MRTDRLPAQFPSSLINPDPDNFSPRVGFACRPSQKHSLIFRGGYSIFFSGSSYAQIAAKLAAQPPFATTGSKAPISADPLTLQDGFPTQPSVITNTWAINKNYKLAYAQTWSLAVQQTLPSNTIVELEYIGTKGTRLGVQMAPNQATSGSALNGATSLTIANASSFLYQTDSGNSIFHAGQVRITRRLSRGMSATALYTFSKSIDDASSFNGLGGTVVQNPQDLSRRARPVEFRSAEPLLAHLHARLARRHSWLIPQWRLEDEGLFRAGRSTALSPPIPARP